jgi:APA family basic amino acid/polyamine antiporter
VAAGTIIVLSAANIAGVRYGSAIQLVFACIKVGALLALIGAVFAFGDGDASRWYVPDEEIAGGAAGVAAATKSVLYTLNGWVYISLVAGEVMQPERRLVRIILAGTGAVVVLYLAANLAYLYVIPLAAMPGTVVAREAIEQIAGPAAGTLLSACILASVCGAMNGVIFTKSRVAYALARDRLSFSMLGYAHPTRATPYVSITVQGVVAVALIAALNDPLRPLRLFDRLTAYFVLVEWLALLFAIGAVFVLRRKMADAPRPYRTPGYPVVPIVFIVGTVVGLGAILWSSCSHGDYSPLFGLALVAAGYPVYYIWRRRWGVTTPPVAPEKEPDKVSSAE